MFDTTRTVGARVTGPSHAAAGFGCDDAFAWRQFGDSVQVLAVADGAGSVTGTSAWGSWAATQFVVSEDISANLVMDLVAAVSDSVKVEKLLRILFLGALQRVAYQGSRLGIPLKLLNTTLAVAVLTPVQAWVAEIGDGIIGVPWEGKAKTILVEEKGDGPASDTYFLQLLGSSPDHLAFRCVALDPISAIAMSTDGLRYQLTRTTDNYSAFPGAFEALWKNAARGWPEAKLSEFLASIPVESDPPGDDKTLLLAVRKPVAPESDWLGLVVPGINTTTTASSPMPPPVPKTSHDAKPSVEATDTPELSPTQRRSSSGSVAADSAITSAHEAEVKSSTGTAPGDSGQRPVAANSGANIVSSSPALPRGGHIQHDVQPSLGPSSLGTQPHRPISAAPMRDESQEKCFLERAADGIRSFFGGDGSSERAAVERASSAGSYTSIPTGQARAASDGLARSAMHEDDSTTKPEPFGSSPNGQKEHRTSGSSHRPSEPERRKP